MMDDCGPDKPIWSATRSNGLRLRLPVSLCLSVCPSARLLIDIKPISCCILICLLTICGSLPRQPMPLSLCQFFPTSVSFCFSFRGSFRVGGQSKWNYVKMTKRQREMATFAWLLIAQQTFTIVACLNLHTQWQRYGQKTWHRQTDRQPYDPSPPLFASLLCRIAACRINCHAKVQKLRLINHKCKACAWVAPARRKKEWNSGGSRGGVSRDSDRQKGQMDEQAKGPRIIYKVAAA